MKTMLSSLLAAIGGVALCSAVAVAQGGPPPRQQPQFAPNGGGQPPAGQPGPAPAYRGPVALVDVGSIFKNHPEFQQKMEGMKKEVEALENELRQEHQNIAKDTERLAQFNSGTPQYKQLEEQLAEGRAKLQARAQLKRDEFLKREAQAYFDFYGKVQQAVGAFAHSNRILVVLRFNRDEMDPNDRNSVLQGVNRPVVHFQQNMDITEDVMRTMGINMQAMPGKTAQLPKAGPAGYPPSNLK